jgi:oligopeptide/dipeptide ABC transporter ATP-binding protein
VSTSDRPPPTERLPVDDGGSPGKPGSAPKPPPPPPPEHREERRGRPLVVAEKLSKLYPIPGGLFRKTRFVHAVDGVSLYIRRGETLGLVGESGCGKSTLGRVLIRLIEPNLGRMVFDGRDITRMPSAELAALRRRMQIVFQDPYASLNPRMTVREIVGEGIAIHRLCRTRREADERVLSVLSRVGLGADTMARYPHELSGGQRQRVGIARALAVEPDFIVCDEPVSALDLSVQAQVLNLLESLQDDLGLSLLFISHDLRVVEYTSHRVAVMYLGRIVETGPSADVAARRYHPYTRALFAAAPGRDPEGRRRLVLQGEPASAADPPPGCAFHPRCSRAQKGRCDVEMPQLEELIPGSHHRVACWHPETSTEG